MHIIFCLAILKRKQEKEDDLTVSSCSLRLLCMVNIFNILASAVLFCIILCFNATCGFSPVVICVFRPIPPSQAVMAVSNTYGRVCKPTGFNLIGLFSAIQGFTGGDSDSNTDCSLWMPIAPPGYTALGSVANIGNEPPPKHIVYCIRSDLVTSTTFIESLFCSPSNPQFTSGFSIWRVENVLGSFYAHSSTECPSGDKCCNLNHLLLWNSSRHRSSAKETASDLAVAENRESQESRNQSHTSGWDIVRSISKATKCYMSTPNFERIWWEKGSDIRRPVSIWRPIPRRGYAILGDCITEG